MTLSPLADAGLVVQAHVVAALSALVLGAMQLALPKGTTRHRLLGWV
ncbi:hypothetical protein [Methylobacterium brachythecii]|uniref:Putative membrane protein n=1 Tax=Methylobacterium brachythecii TaxID=1176177 RepID=A0A7W6AK19_9HYPH|nr:hypothetical protein [Methylobacterium brachythecii]MBB3904855.1 putative membrane protein [Methylobacterium brachythecii]GLS46668.1 hypothetical protein GCM10007884_46620 [Methylobacterium brachythecii]